MPKQLRMRAKRDSNELEIVAALRKLGASVVYLNMPDVPDLLCGINSTTLLIEVKEPKGKLRQGQIEFAEAWKGSPVKVIRSVKDVYELINSYDSKKQTTDMSELPQNFYWGKAKCLLF